MIEINDIEVSLSVAIFAITLSAFLPHRLIKNITDSLNMKIENNLRGQETKNDKRADLGLAGYVGYLERAFYSASIIFNFYSFILFLISIKTAGGFKYWNPENDTLSHIGRARFQVFLIGTLISLGFTATITLIIENIV